MRMEKKLKITIKLISLSHQEWVEYLENLMNLYDLNFHVVKDTYYCFGNENILNEIQKISDDLEKKDKKIIVTQGGI